MLWFDIVPQAPTSLSLSLSLSLFLNNKISLTGLSLSLWGLCSSSYALS